MMAAKNAPHFPRVWLGRLAPLATTGKRLGYAALFVVFAALAWPAVALMDTFFIFSGFALVAFLAAWKAGHFQELDQMGGIPLLVQEDDYYTPEWALDEEEWTE